MSKDAASHWSSYRDVDASANTASLSEELDEIASMPGVAAEKRRSLELLELELGSSVLDVGCGNGPELKPLAAMVGPSGRVVGLDSSATLINVANSRALAEVQPIELVLADAHSLPFDDCLFDACRADRTLQHLARADDAIAEMVRVVRPHGRLVITESMWTLEAPELDLELTKKVVDVLSSKYERQQWLGYLLPMMLKLGGLTGVGMSSGVYPTSDYRDIAQCLKLPWSLDRVVEQGIVSSVAARNWHEHLRRLAVQGHAHIVTTVVHAVGTKPG